MIAELLQKQFPFKSSMQVLPWKDYVQKGMRIGNVNKQIRIANATTGEERLIHVKRANLLAHRYGIELPFTAEAY